MKFQESIRTPGMKEGGSVEKYNTPRHAGATHYESYTAPRMDDPARRAETLETLKQAGLLGASLAAPVGVGALARMARISGKAPKALIPLLRAFKNSASVSPLNAIGAEMVKGASMGLPYAVDEGSAHPMLDMAALGAVIGMPRAVGQGVNWAAQNLRRSGTPTLVSSESATPAGRLQELFFKRGTGEPVPAGPFTDEARRAEVMMDKIARRDVGGPYAEVEPRFGQGAWVGDNGVEFNTLQQQSLPLGGGDLRDSPELLRYISQLGANKEQQVVPAVRAVPIPFREGANAIEMHPRAGMSDELTRALGAKMPWNVPAVQTPSGSTLLYGLIDDATGAVPNVRDVERSIRRANPELGNMVQRKSYNFIGPQDRAAYKEWMPYENVPVQPPSAGLRAMREYADSLSPEIRARVAAERRAQGMAEYLPPNADFGNYVLAEP